MSRARDWYRVGLLASFALLLNEIAQVQVERAGRALFPAPEDDLEAADCSDVLEAHGVTVA